MRLECQRIARAVRIGVAIDADHGDLKRGIEFGIEEARHSAKLLGQDVVAVDMARDETANVAAVLVGAFVSDSIRRGWASSGTAVLRLAGDAREALRARERNELVLFPRRHVIEAVGARVPPQAGDVERRVEVWHGSLERFGARQLNDRYRARFGADMSSDAWLGWFATKVVWESVARLRGSSVALLSYVADPSRRFDGHKGFGLRFDENGELVQPLYVLERRAGAEAWMVVHEVRP
jgi:hypothetical protein